MLLICAYTGSIASMLFIFISPSVYYLAPLLVIAGVTSLGFSFVLLNAFLPLLVANHPSSSELKSLHSFSSTSLDQEELEAFNPNGSNEETRHQAHPEKLANDLKRSAAISSKGVGYGYMAAVFVQLIAIGILFAFSKTPFGKSHPTFPMRVILFLAGLWWALSPLPTRLWLRPRPGPPPPESSTLGAHPSRLRRLTHHLTFSLRSFYRTLRRALRLPQTLLFLTAWFLLSDSVATISGTAVLFARTELHMSTIAIACLSITSISSGIAGAFLWPRVAAYFNLNAKTILICCIAGMELIPLYGLLGYVPLFRAWGVIGLQKQWEIFPVAVVHGIVMGGISSYARAVYAPLIPPGSEAAFFALYAVTDKGSSAVGPAVVGGIVDRAGSIRPAFVFLAVLVVLPAPLLWALNVEKGREDARGLAEREGVGKRSYQRVGEGE